MSNNQLQECISECESALNHLNNAMGKMDHANSKQKLQHATKDLEDCIAECRSLL